MAKRVQRQLVVSTMMWAHELKRVQERPLPFLPPVQVRTVWILSAEPEGPISQLRTGSSRGPVGRAAILNICDIPLDPSISSLDGKYRGVGGKISPLPSEAASRSSGCSTEGFYDSAGVGALGFLHTGLVTRPRGKTDTDSCSYSFLRYNFLPREKIKNQGGNAQVANRRLRQLSGWLLWLGALTKLPLPQRHFETLSHGSQAAAFTAFLDRAISSPKTPKNLNEDRTPRSPLPLSAST